jgi:RNA polymerase-binding transcription factor DksA
LTGKPIESARLEAVPWARFSLAAEKKLEEQGTRRRTTLGERESVGKFEPVSDEDLEAD